jgi:hypothetical protein
MPLLNALIALTAMKYSVPISLKILIKSKKLLSNGSGFTTRIALMQRREVITYFINNKLNFPLGSAYLNGDITTVLMAN